MGGEAVIQSCAPATAESSVQLDPQSVVNGLANARVPGVHVTEMRIRAQQLAKRQGAFPAKRSEPRIAVEGIGVVLVQLIAQGKVRIGELVDVDRRIEGASDRQVGSPTADVTDLDRHVTPDVLLNIGRPLLDVRRVTVLLVEVHVGANVLESSG